MKKDFNDGVCEACGNTGLAGENCLVCGGVLTSLKTNENTSSSFDDDIDSSSSERYPIEPLEAADDEIEEKTGEISDDNY